MAKGKAVTPKEILEGAAIISISANRMNDMEENIFKILSHLNNDEDTGSPGLVQRQREDRYRIEALEKFTDKIWVRLGGIAFLGGGTALAIWKFIFKL